MLFGTPGKILHINLTESSFSIETIQDDFYRLYPGGKALARYYLLHEIPAHANPLGPENVLVIACGLFRDRHPCREKATRTRPFLVK